MCVVHSVREGRGWSESGGFHVVRRVLWRTLGFASLLLIPPAPPSRPSPPPTSPRPRLQVVPLFSQVPNKHLARPHFSGEQGGGRELLRGVKGEFIPEPKREPTIARPDSAGVAWCRVTWVRAFLFGTPVS